VRTLFLDFESFFGTLRRNDKAYNLSLKNPKLSYTDYVRDPDFEVLGVSYMWEDSDEDPKFVKGPEVSAFLETIDWERTRVVAHNAVFDGLILYETYGVVPAQYFCTMAAAEWFFQGATPVGLDALCELFDLGRKSPELDDFRGKRCKDIDDLGWQRLANYANNDVLLLARLYTVLSSTLPTSEVELMSNTIMLFCNPVMVVNVDIAREALHEAEQERDQLVEATGLSLQEISGNISFESALRRELGGEIPQKLNKNGEVKPAFAKTDLEFIKLVTHESPRVRALVKARLEVKSSLNIKRAQRLIDLGTSGSRMANICLHFGRAHTLRWTGGNKMNPQNFTRGSKLRLALRAPQDNVLIVVDSSQVEARFLAAVARQKDLINIFRAGDDPYSAMASVVYERKITKATDPVERFMGKTMVLGLGYGMGWRKFYNEIRTGARGLALDIEPEFAQRAVMKYRQTVPHIMAFHKEAEEWLWYMVNDLNPPRIVLNDLVTLDPKTKRVIFPNGCFLRYPKLTHEGRDLMYHTFNPRTRKYEWRKIYGGMFVENFIQALARHCVADQILKISKKYRTALFVHDECVYVAPEAEAQEALEFGIDTFREVPSWLEGRIDIPLDSEGGYDYCYSK
jgi:DNA polymerase I-like protein with 3'-5' exonuclease and polymerase domains